MKKKGSFEWTLEADAAFQDLKRYLTSPPVMVAPHPLEPLVLYLASTPHSASATLVAVREERLVKGSWSSTSYPVGMSRPQDGAPEALAAPPVSVAPKDGIPEAMAAPTHDQPPEVPQSQEVQDPADASTLVEHPVKIPLSPLDTSNSAGRVHRPPHPNQSPRDTSPPPPLLANQAPPPHPAGSPPPRLSTAGPPSPSQALPGPAPRSAARRSSAAALALRRRCLLASVARTPATTRRPAARTPATASSPELQPPPPHLFTGAAPALPRPVRSTFLTTSASAPSPEKLAAGVDLPLDQIHREL
nr:proline-rich protein 36-like [Aegilops tauschii subsp. strangulata]